MIHSTSFLGDDPFKCMEKGDLVTACNSAMYPHLQSFYHRIQFLNILNLLFSVEQLKSKYTVEFEAFKKCLDYNDYRYANCRVEEKALYDCWNKDNYPTKN